MHDGIFWHKQVIEMQIHTFFTVQNITVYVYAISITYNKFEKIRYLQCQ